MHICTEAEGMSMMMPTSKSSLMRASCIRLSLWLRARLFLATFKAALLPLQPCQALAAIALAQALLYGAVASSKGLLKSAILSQKLCVTTTSAQIVSLISLNAQATDVRHHLCRWMMISSLPVQAAAHRLQWPGRDHPDQESYMPALT